MPRARGNPAPEPPPIAGPGNFHAEGRELGLWEARWMNRAVRCDDGTWRYVPRDLVAFDGQAVILWRAAGDGGYDFDGWEPQLGHMHGGRRQKLESAFAWLRRARDVKAGRASDFLGV